MHRKVLAVAGLLLSVVLPAHTQDDPLAMFDGVWVTSTPPIKHMIFYKVGLSREAGLPFGQASIRVSDGTDGSNLRVSGAGFDCYYWVGMINPKRMAWEFKSGSALCLRSMTLDHEGGGRDPGMREVENLKREVERLKREAAAEAERLKREAAAEAERLKREAAAEAKRLKREKTFRFKVCNNSSGDVSTARKYYSEELRAYVVEGWGNVKRGTCETWRRPRGWFHYFAINNNRLWIGNHKVCIAAKSYRRIDQSGYTCRSDEKLVGFNSTYVTDKEFVWNLEDAGSTIYPDGYYWPN